MVILKAFWKSKIVEVMLCLPFLFEIANFDILIIIIIVSFVDYVYNDYFIKEFNLLATEIYILLKCCRRNDFAIYAPSIYSALPLSLKCQNTSPSKMDFLCIIHAHQ